MKAKNFLQPACYKCAYDKLIENDKNVIVGGGLWLKRSDTEYDTLIDLSKANLNTYEETSDAYILGSMMTLRDVELSSVGTTHLDGVLGKAINQVMGVQLRNMATIGGTIMGKFPFSDVLTPLLMMDVTLNMYPERKISLVDFLKEKKRVKEILVSIEIKKETGKAAFKKVKITDLGFALLNVAVAKVNDKYRIALGARPLVATLATKAMDLLNTEGASDENIEKAGQLVTEELMFLDAVNASKDYRLQLARVYTKRLLKEVR